MERRRDQRWKFILPGVFVAIALFTFLVQNYKKSESEVEAASLASFDPGYIISDYQMGNYSSMSEAEIQSFLTVKNACANTDYSYYLKLSANTNYTWHFENGHFVCLSEELFGDGEVIGSGETAAHIIWQAAQDYKINPQVLIVLLQKETGLITDPIPNDKDYRKATGYGCPDTAACSSEYYGFKNQVRKAAELFRTVLDGGWTNYPLGENYVQYNPSASCGGTVVNIRSLATSALYRYTPYQPNAAALAVGYGYGDSCSAYGNRNFYLYFQDWFSGITMEASYVSLEAPRDMKAGNGAKIVDPYTGAEVGDLAEGVVKKYTSKIWLNSNEWCLRSEDDYEKRSTSCVKLSDLREIYEDFQNPRYMRIVKDTNRINPYTGEYYDTLEKGRVLKYVTKIRVGGKWYYRTEYMSNNNMDVVVSSDDLEDFSYVDFITPRYMQVSENGYLVNPYDGTQYKALEEGKILKYTTKIEINNEWYYRDEAATKDDLDMAVPSDILEEVPEYQDFINPREMVLVEDIERVNPYTGEVFDTLEKGRVLEFTTKIFVNGEWYYRTKYMSELDLDVAVLATSTGEL